MLGASNFSVPTVNYYVALDVLYHMQGVVNSKTSFWPRIT